MKSTIYTYYLYLALLCTPVLFGAATSGATPVEQYQQALQQGNINAIVAAYAELPQEMRRAPEIYAPLVRALLADKPTDEATIATLQHIFINVHHPVLKWVLRNDRTELDQRLNQLEPAQPILRDDQEHEKTSETMATLEERYQAAQQEQTAPASSSEQTLLSDDREKKRTERTGLLATLEQPAKRQRMGKDTPTVHELALHSITKDIAQKGLLNVQSAEDLHALITNVISPDQLTKLRGAGLYEMIFNRLANILAKDYFLKLSAEKEGRKPELLPDWLHEHFTGVSIQDLLDYKIDLKSLIHSIGQKTELELNQMYINDLTGLKNIGITNFTSLNLSDNLITSIEPNIFTGFQTLNNLDLSYNQIAFLEPGVFTDLQELNELNLANNQVTSLEPGVFTGLQELSQLNLENNQITSLKPNTFADLQNLAALLLSNNRITSLEPGVFTGLQEVIGIDLKGNQITYLGFDILDDLPELLILELADNQIDFIEPGVFANIRGGFEKINLYGNPIAHDPEERARIKEEVRIASDGYAIVAWSVEEE